MADEKLFIFTYTTIPIFLYLLHSLFIENKKVCSVLNLFYYVAVFIVFYYRMESLENLTTMVDYSSKPGKMTQKELEELVSREAFKGGLLRFKTQ